MASKRKDEILKTALDLFNENGASEVTTNHIAKAMQISPGNLYYYFGSKEAIIAAILEQMVEAWNPIYEIDVSQSFGLEGLEASIRHSFQLIWRYRFFYREVPLLLSRDPELKERYFAIRDQRLEQQVAFARRLAAAGALQLPEEDSEVRQIFTIAWLIADSWLAYQELENVQIDEAIESGVQLTITLYRPYLGSQ